MKVLKEGSVGNIMRVFVIFSTTVSSNHINPIILFISSEVPYYYIMFPNTNRFICSSYTSSLTPLTQKMQLQLIPYNFQRKTDRSFFYCDLKDNQSTHIVQLAYPSIEKTSVQEFMGIYEYSCFGDDHALLVNRQGDILYYDFLTESTFFIEKQHPSLYSTIQIHNFNQAFATCGGNVRNSHAQNEKLIKLWIPEGEELLMKCRIVTGHTKMISNSVTMGRNKILTMSTDKTVRCVNLTTQQIESVIPVEMDYYSGCPMDWNTVLLGGIGTKMDIYDPRSKRLIATHNLTKDIIQISKICKLNDHNVIFSNVNQLLVMDLRTMTAEMKGEYAGERICEIAAISGRDLIVGNMDKSLQIWSCC